MADVLLLVFPSRGALVDAADTIRKLPYLDVKNTAVIAKAESGEALVFEDDISPKEGAIAGGTLGSLMTALGVAQLGAFLLPGVGPIVAIGAGAIIGALVGSTAGGLTAKLIDFGFDNEQLAALADHLETGRTALAVEVESSANVLPRLQTDLQAYATDIMVPPQT